MPNTNTSETELLLQVDVGDQVKVKQVLDEAVAAAILDLDGMAENYSWDNTKLSIMALACVFALLAQFVPIPFPESRPVLGVCGSLYFVLSGVLQYITTFIDKDAILLTLPNQKALHQHGIRVRSSLPRFSEFYTVTLEFYYNANDTTKTQQARKVEKIWSVGQFFDNEGYFDEAGLIQEIEKLYKQFEEWNYTSASTAAPEAKAPVNKGGSKSKKKQ
jgi:signal peptidase complex subunit 2